MMEFLYAIYIPVSIKSIAKYTLKDPSGIPLESNAPVIAPGIDKAAILSPTLKSIRFCFEYAIVEEILVEVTAIRLVLAIWDGMSPIKARAGVIMIPPPTPIIDPSVPAPRPITIKIIMISINI